MKKKIIIGLACLTAGIGLAGCGASSYTGNITETTTTTAEVATTAEVTTTVETTTTEETTTATTEAPTTTTTEAPNTTANAHPEDEQIMENLRNFYKSHEIVDGVPVDTDYGMVKYTKYAIADFDADGENEVMIEEEESFPGTHYVLSMYDDDISLDAVYEDIPAGIPYKEISEVTFLDNGVAYSPEDRFLDGKKYYILSSEMLSKLNYNMSLTYYSAEKVLTYSAENGTIYKHLASAQDSLFPDKEKTQAEYEAEKAILNSGNVMNIEIKDFTAENIGL